MTQLVAKYAMKKVLGKEMEKYKGKGPSGPYDPYYEEIPHPRKPGKTKKVKKEIPAYIPPHDADVLAKARKTAYRLDYALFSFAGLRFGWSSVIGLVPAAGDVADAALSLNLIRGMCKVEGGLPQMVMMWMAINLIIDFLVGLVPFIGDLADAAVKCNGKNVRLLEEHLDAKYKPKEVRDIESRMSPESRPRPASVYVDLNDSPGDERNDPFNNRNDHVRQPTRAYSGRRDRVPDEEMGVPRHEAQRSHKNDRSRRDNRR
ncbi:hypothetical protein P153DRAFT_369308 [Dothidotthia symphoricarpi CBS 119687]|uniref:PH domain-containing protein n=1 Tax=Dothidotthia symphoricarpi CBS 119687 TaxID=1392245 RepID=A0A6A6A744_9PLEO|nr:uncharacterized protein P153DRAFT_369308 [Dothidotthia symphoricarpi CBS 119687]KAF2126627.1 hypothetical protein P153DRAFT_369308 [Dothidotthia symphoricarpi CBS 119687]